MWMDVARMGGASMIQRWEKHAINAGDWFFPFFKLYTLQSVSINLMLSSCCYHFTSMPFIHLSAPFARGKWWKKIMHVAWKTNGLVAHCYAFKAREDRTGVWIPAFTTHQYSKKRMAYDNCSKTHCTQFSYIIVNIKFVNFIHLTWNRNSIC
jgi:hypothetical protein